MNGFPNGKLEIPSGIETIGHKQWEVPFFVPISGASNATLLEISAAAAAFISMTSSPDGVHLQHHLERTSHYPCSFILYTGDVIK